MVNYNPQVHNHRGYWPWVSIMQLVPDPMTTAESEKDERYHVRRARYCLGIQNPQYMNWMRSCYATNLFFDRGGFGLEEDIQTFLMDKGLPTSRKALVYPVIGPMKLRLVGQADGVSVSAQAQATTQMARTRKELSLAKTMLLSEAAMEGPMMASAIEQNYGVSANPDEAEAMHENTYQDHLIRAINSLLEMLSKKNKFDRMRRPIAERLALSGLAAAHCAPHGQNLIWEVCEPNEVGWDHQCVQPDFSDASYVYSCPLMSITDIGERWHAKRNQMEILDNYARNVANGYSGSWPQMSPRVFTVYWRDGNYQDWGYVKDEDGVKYCQINKADPSKRDGKPEYTDRDLVTPPENKFTAKWSSEEVAKKKQSVWTQVLRYCVFIPWEYMPGAYTQGKNYTDGAKLQHVRENGVNDMVFEYGEYPIQEVYPDDVHTVKFPLKFSTWSYMGGYVISPLTAAQGPQRVMNQVTSNIVWRMSKQGNKSIVMDKDAIAGSGMPKKQILQNLKEGDPIEVKGAVVGSVANAIHAIDNGPSAGDAAQWQLLEQLHQLSQQATGIYDQNYGAPGANDQLVGTKQLQLQQAGIMMQPFYAALADLFEQMHQFNAQGGKQFYADRPWLLEEMVGDEGTAAIIASKEMQLEQFRITVKLTPDSDKIKQITDNIILGQLLPVGLLDPASAAQLLGRSFPEDAYEMSRKYTKQAVEAAKAQAQAMQQQQVQQQVAEQSAAIDGQQVDLYDQMLNASLASDKENLKAEAPMRQAMSEHMKPQETSAPL